MADDRLDSESTSEESASEQLAREERLNALQLESLGSDRRERISKDDYRENQRNSTSLRALEAARLANRPGTVEYQVAKERRVDLDRWNNAWQGLQDDGTVEERLEDISAGQTHRAKLAADIAVQPMSSQNVIHGRITTISGPNNHRGGRETRGGGFPSTRGRGSRVRVPTRSTRDATLPSLSKPQSAQSQSTSTNIQTRKLAQNPKVVTSPGTTTSKPTSEDRLRRQLRREHQVEALSVPLQITPLFQLASPDQFMARVQPRNTQSAATPILTSSDPTARPSPVVPFPPVVRLSPGVSEIPTEGRKLSTFFPQAPNAEDSDAVPAPVIFSAEIDAAPLGVRRHTPPSSPVRANQVSYLNDLVGLEVSPVSIFKPQGEDAAPYLSNLLDPQATWTRNVEAGDFERRDYHSIFGERISQPDFVREMPTVQGEALQKSLTDLSQPSMTNMNDLDSQLKTLAVDLSTETSTHSIAPYKISSDALGSLGLLADLTRSTYALGEHIRNSTTLGTSHVEIKTRTGSVTLTVGEHLLPSGSAVTESETKPSDVMSPVDKMREDPSPPIVELSQLRPENSDEPVRKRATRNPFMTLSASDVARSNTTAVAPMDPVRTSVINMHITATNVDPPQSASSASANSYGPPSARRNLLNPALVTRPPLVGRTTPNMPTSAIARQYGVSNGSRENLPLSPVINDPQVSDASHSLEASRFAPPFTGPAIPRRSALNDTGFLGERTNRPSRDGNAVNAKDPWDIARKKCL